MRISTAAFMETDTTGKSRSIRMAELPSGRPVLRSWREDERIAAKLLAGDTVGMTGEVTIVHGDGSVRLRLHSYDIPVTVRAEHLSLSRDGGSRCSTIRTEVDSIVAMFGRRVFLPRRSRVLNVDPPVDTPHPIARPKSTD